ncbi:GntR family transcriptional regulator [Rhizobacter sp. J219]|jgi:DNA-binding GntR family transcriptional regulator|uniref:GntR family transcriptional regulator n=1 Tax=Rhizobacter sp. J219 TaxID=2898430 RepID=UPI002151E63D|nr:GntR family transcriptional regulator [Rhizobacter sp. J219]MCR5885649.1 GntR family transcriptional regulator [Rhizobacter sp. J219]
MDPINTPTYLRLREQIRADIVAGVWALGSHLTLAELSEHYQVSANPVREALLQLQGEGVIDMRMHRGAVIPAVDERYIHNIYGLRGAIQSMLAREAALRATPEQIKQLQRLVDAHEAAAASNDVPASVTANRHFHAFLDGLADNPPALEVLESRASLVDAFRRSKGYGAGRLDLVIAQHRKLVRAIAKHDADRAAAAALEHAESARDDLLKLLAPA